MFQAFVKAPINAIVLSGAVIVGLAAMQPVYAAGEGTTTTTPSCKKKHVWDKRRKKCVKVKKTSNLSDDNIYDAARDLAYSKRYEEAITILQLAKNKQEPSYSKLPWIRHPQVRRCAKGLEILSGCTCG